MHFFLTEAERFQLKLVPLGRSKIEHRVDIYQFELGWIKPEIFLSGRILNQMRSHEIYQVAF